MRSTTSKRDQRTRRHARIRAKVFGTAERPRLAVFRSNQYIYAQLIDDVAGVTLAATRSEDMGEGKPGERAHNVGETIAKMAQEKKITKAVFDRGGFLFSGNVKAVAEGARAGGLAL